MSIVREKLVFDLGANAGQDSAYYLGLGYDVVAVEANPSLAAGLAQRFAAEAAAGRFTLLASGIWSETKTLTFYENLDNDHWSSFDPVYGCRDGTRFVEHRIPCVRVGALLADFGVPYYMKIDIEGADRHVLVDLQTERQLPAYISVEEYGVGAVDDLAALGYTKMALVPQRTKPVGKDNHRFTGQDSGPIGPDLPYPWLETATFRDHFLRSVRDEMYRYVGPEHEWFDIHATR
jgi:FkbM family methyltransferase